MAEKQLKMWKEMDKAFQSNKKMNSIYQQHLSKKCHSFLLFVFFLNDIHTFFLFVPEESGLSRMIEN